MGTFKTPSVSFKKIILSYLLCLLVITEASAACNKGCPSPNQNTKYKFAAGSVYHYNIDSVVTIFLAGNDAQETNLKIQGQADLYAQGNCGYTLKINKLQVSGSKQTFGNEISKPVQFTLSNDEIAPEICTDADDTEVSLNLKRAIISLFQTADSKTYETDIFGTCPTTFSSTNPGQNTVIVNKIRNLNLCSHRELLAGGLVTSVLNENSAIKSTPLLNGDYNNELRIEGGILQSAQLNEAYYYLPFSTGEAGARAKVSTRITLAGKPTQGAAPKDGNDKSTIVFRNPTAIPMSNINNIKAALKNTVQSYSNNVGPTAARQFTELIRLMRFTKKTDLLTLYSQVKSGTVHEKAALTRKVYFDALFRVGTGDSVEVVADLSKNELKGDEVKLAFLSFNLVQSMTKEALLSINKLVDSNPPKEAYLSIGTLVSKYCSEYSCESADIKSISDKFGKKIANCKATPSRNDEDLHVAVLKGLRNTNNLFSPALEKVIDCTNDKSSTRVRVSAIKALTAAGCNKKSQAALLKILKNQQEDSELRIEAYLAAVSCPSGQLANEIKSVLDSETVYQVGSFIVSHLASLRSSTDPSKEAGRSHFAQVRTTKKFPFDFRRFSFNREFSYAVDSLGLGSAIDTSVIYSQKSFLPRSTNLNITGEIFGNAFNVLELSARQENLDLLVEHYFGPKGFFKTGSPQEIYDKLSSHFNKFAQHYRSRRGAKEESIAFGKTVNMGNDVNSDFDLDLSIKFFGSEMFFLSLGEQLPNSPEAFLDKFMECMDKGLTGAKSFDHTFEHHSLFLDADLSYPTGVGFPIKLQAQGTGVVRLETKGEINFREILKDIKKTKFNIKVVPSANFEITATLLVDCFTVSTGLQVSGNVHSSTGADIKFGLLNEGQGFDVEIGMPVKKQEFLSFEHKIVFVNQERGNEQTETPLKFSSKKKDIINACFDQLHPIIGLTLCAEATVTVPGSTGVAPFPLNGGNKLALSFEVVDKYHFMGLYDDKNPKHQSITVLFDTPGSTENRKTTVKFEAAVEPKIFTKLTLVSPIKNAEVEAGLNNDDKEVSLYARAQTGPEEYLAKIGFKKNGGGGARQEYTPIVVLNRGKQMENNLLGYNIAGKIIVDKQENGEKYTFNNIQIIAPAQEPLTLNGVITRDGTKITSDMNFKKSQYKGNVKGELQLGTEHVILDFGLTSNFHEHANGRVKYEMNRGENEIKNDFLFIYGDDLNSKTKRIELFQHAKWEDEGKRLKSLSFENKILLAYVPFTLKLDGDFSKNSHKFDFELSGSRVQKIIVNLDSKTNGKSAGDFDVHFNAGLNSHTVKLISKRVIDNNKSRLTNKLEISTGTRIELNGVVAHKYSADDADINVEGIFVMADKQEPYRATVVILVNTKLANTNIKVFGGKQEIASYESKIVRGDNSNGKFDVKINQILTGTGEFKSNKGKGDANFLITFEKLARKIKTDVKFVISAPNYEVSTDFYYDFEKDNTKKVTFSTKTKATKSMFDSKNNLDIFTEKYGFNVQGSLDGAAVNDGIIKGKFDLSLPTGRVLSGEINREVHVKSAGSVGSAEIKLNDRLPNKKSRTFILSGKINKGDFQANLFDIDHTIKYTDFENKNIVIESNIKHLPKDHFKLAAVTFNIQGSLLPETIDFNIIVDEYCEKHAVYKVSGKYGGQFEASLKGKHEVGGRAKPAMFEITAGVNSPLTKFKSFKLESAGSFLQPETDNGLYETKFSTKASVDAKSISFDSNGKGNRNHGNVKLALDIPGIDSVSAEGTYSHIDSGESTKCQGAVQLGYGAGKTIKASTTINTVGNNEISVYGTLETPFEHAKKVDLTFKATKANEQNYNTNTQIIVDDKKYGFTTAFVLSDSTPSADVNLFYPSNNVRLYGSFNRLGDKKYNGNVIIKNFYDFNVDATGEASYQSVENFYLKLDVDAPKIKLNKVHVDVHSKQGSGGKGVEFLATSNSKNVLSGSAEYTIKEEKGVTIIKGQGTVKIDDQSKAASFEFKRNYFDGTKDDGTGALFGLEGKLGPKNFLADLKMTDKVFHSKFTVCEEKKPCINVEIKSLVKKADLENWEHELAVEIDLRELGYSHEFGLKSQTSRKGFLIDHDVDMHFHSQDKNKYQYSCYIHPTKAGVVLTLPKRVVSVEAAYTIPKDGFGLYDTTIVFYLDKVNNGNSKATIGFTGEVTRLAKTAISAKGEFKVVHPLMKTLSISGQGEVNGDSQTAFGKLELDIFKQSAQKIIAQSKYENSDKSGSGYNITSQSSIVSKGLGLEYSFNGHTALSVERKEISSSASIITSVEDLKWGTYLFANTKQFDFSVEGMKEQIVKANAKYDLQKDVIEMNSALRFLGATPIETSTKINGWTSFVFNLNRGNVLNINGEITAGKQAFLKIAGSGKELFNGKIALDTTHFLTSEYKVQDAEVKAFLKTVQGAFKSDLEAAKNELLRRFAIVQNNALKTYESMKTACPDFTNVANEYKQQLTKMAEELLQDKTIKELVEFMTKIFGVLSKTYGEIYNIAIENFKKISTTVTDFYKSLLDTFTQKILPALKDVYGKVEQALFAMYQETIDLLSAVFERTIKALKVFEEDFNKVGKVFSEVFKNFATAAAKWIEVLRKEVKDIYELVSNYLKTLPGLDFIKEKYETLFAEYKIPETVLSVLKDLSSLLKQSVPTKAIADFVDTTLAYIEKKLTNKDVNDLESIKKIYLDFVQALHSVISMVKSQFGEIGTGKIATPIPFSLEALKRLPYITSINFSPFNYFKNEKMLSIRELIANYRPYGFDPMSIIPPFTMHGQIADGQHIFTFDGRHLTFPGTCNYILAQDFINNNFSIIANLNNGKMKSITLVDKSNSIEITENGIASLNGKPADLPIHKNDIHSWREYYTISIFTSFGASVECSTDLRICHFTVSGFYLGKTRGLLGNGNSEPFDDYQLPNGKIADNSADFANAYKSTKTCKPVAFDDHAKHAHSNDLCTKFFSSDSSLRYGFYFVDQTNYREACEHAVDTATDKLDAACNIAEMYTSSCRKEMIPVDIPSECKKCEAKNIDIGDAFSVKSPSKQADVVFVVDTELGSLLDDLVQNTITDLRKELKSRDVTDVQILIIGYSKFSKYISKYTHNGKLDFTGKLSAIKHDAGPREYKALKTGYTKVDEILDTLHENHLKVKDDMGLAADARAFQAAMDYPFRSSASKAIIAVRSDALENTSNPIKQLWTAYASETVKDEGISVHVITPVKDLALSGKDSKNLKNVVGFNSKSVLLINDFKKRANIGSTDMRANLKFTTDLGIDTVEESNGFVYVLQNFAQLKAQKEKKNFITVITASLADLMARTEQTLDCKCELKNGLYPSEVCEVTDTKLLAPIKKAGARG